MKTLGIKSIILTTIVFLLTSVVFAHPTGNLITAGENVLWSYVNPLDDPNHYACVMIWKKGSEPKVLIRSAYAASDYMLWNNQNEIYIIERKYLQKTDHFEVRLLKTDLENKPEVIWDWFKDDHRMGEGGFFMLSDNQIVFGKYPEIVTLTKGEKPKRYFKFNQPIKRIRAVQNNQILLLSNNSCYLTQQDGTVLKQWNKLIDPGVKNAPLNRNQIFDADYSNGELLFSYWGNRSFDLIDVNGKRKTILKQTEPLTPHWVAFLNYKKLLFSSKLIFDGSMPKPHLVLLNEQNLKKVLWNM
ncbi:hypothetical protein [Ascidiimonas aurantiaca]|uniref:hypothetical protein n=1 Tax=Ascidiimonas aurantiaca TaxID=1685432 RepID=UPI0030EC263A